MSQCKTPYNVVADYASDSESKPFFDSPFFGRVEGLVDTFQDTMDGFYNAGNVISQTTKDNTVAINTVVTDRIEMDPAAFQHTYPDLADRIDLNPFITPIEIDEFISDFFYSGTIFYPVMSGNPPLDFPIPVVDYQNQVLANLDSFYRGSRYNRNGLKNFCSIVPNIFAKVREFAQFFRNVQAIAGRIGDLLGGGGAAAALQAIQSRAESMIQGAMQDGLSRIQNFSFESFQTSFPFGMPPILSRVMDTYETVRSFFTEENMNAIKERINGLIAYAISVFKEPTLEEIEFLIYRFCQLLSNLEETIMGVINPLRNSVARYETARTAISATSGLNTARAVAAGATRLEASERAAAASQAVTQAQETGNGEVTHPTPIGASDVAGVPRWEDIRLGTDDSRLVLDANMSGDTYITDDYDRRNMSRLGWEGVKPEVRVMLMRLQEKWGGRLKCNCGYRSPEYNALLATRSDQVAPGSLHMAGEALDMDWESYPRDRDRFISLAKEVGFRGIGIYTGFVHIDIGRERSWQGN